MAGMRMRDAGGWLVLLLTAAPVAAQEWRGENLQVLPAGISRAEIIARMRDLSSALGVTCSYCHVQTRPGPSLDTYAFPSDEKPTKRTAREMMRMVGAVNELVRPAAEPTNDTPMAVGCITCHRGFPRPLMLEDTLGTVLERQGVDSMVATYDRLRTRYHGRFAFDFGERSLNVLAERSPAPTAVAVLELNARHFPDSWNVAYELGRAYEAVSDTPAAIGQYEKVLRLLPTHEPTQERLRRLRGGGGR